MHAWRQISIKVVVKDWVGSSRINKSQDLAIRSVNICFQEQIATLIELHKQGNQKQKTLRPGKLQKQYKPKGLNK